MKDCLWMTLRPLLHLLSCDYVSAVGSPWANKNSESSKYLLSIESVKVLCIYII